MPQFTFHPSEVPFHSSVSPSSLDPASPPEKLVCLLLFAREIESVSFRPCGLACRWNATRRCCQLSCSESDGGWVSAVWQRSSSKVGAENRKALCAAPSPFSFPLPLFKSGCADSVTFREEKEGISKQITEECGLWELFLSSHQS
ncbi:hypothetical protein ILYODFUR_028765 [Ilyodon furcidens]|uniref:Uncharacterized protein n=1 Tax=Ilyodon furcidens TaxID=33524 RepID=A0ABV0TC82_9TELE